VERREEFRAATLFPHVVIDDFLDPDLVRAVSKEFEAGAYTRSHFRST
jgi:hypothetical protein